MKALFNHSASGVTEAPLTTLSFFLNESYEWLKMKIHFEKRGWIHLFLWDPNGALRLQYLYVRAPETVVIAKDPLQSSYTAVPGIIPKGEWKIEIFDGMFQPKAYAFEWECGNVPLNQEGEMVEQQVWAAGSPLILNIFNENEALQRGRRWYKGDFHTHTYLSDGKLSPLEGMQQAKLMGLDFFVVTDHNLLPAKWVKDEVLAIPGIEITSSKGHFNALGLKEWVDWRPSSADGGMETEAGMNRLLREAGDKGAIRSINHPMLRPWDWCFAETLITEVDVIEIWNDPTYKDNPRATEEALRLWNALWSEGFKIYGIGGSDAHMLPTESYEAGGPPSVIGDPATYVFAEELSASAILNSVRQGKVYVSRGPVLDIHIQAGSQRFPVGSDLTRAIQESDDGIVRCTVEYKNVPEESVMYWIENGEAVKMEDLLSEGKCEYQAVWRPERWVWLRFEIRKRNGELLAFSNPVFAGQNEPSIATWGELLKKAGFNKR